MCYSGTRAQKLGTKVEARRLVFNVCELEEEVEMEVTLALNSKLTKLPGSDIDNGLVAFEVSEQDIFKFAFGWTVEIGPVVVNLKDKDKYSDQIAQDIGNVVG